MKRETDKKQQPKPVGDPWRCQKMNQVGNQCVRVKHADEQHSFEVPEHRHNGSGVN